MSRAGVTQLCVLLTVAGLGCRNLDDDPTACSDPTIACGVDSTIDAPTDSGNHDAVVDMADAHDASVADTSTPVDSGDTSTPADTKDASVDSSDSSSDSDTMTPIDADADAESEVGPTAGWTSMSASPLAGRAKHGAVWTGTEMIVWGGADAAGTTFFNDGAKYNPSTNSWTPIAAVPSGFVGRTDFAIVWTGSAMVVWGGQGSAPGELADGAAYDPSANSWKMLATSPLGTGSRAFGFSTTTGDVIIWGHSAGGGASDTGAYKPLADSWSLLPTAPLSDRGDVNFAWTGLQLFVFGGQNTSSTLLSDGARLNPATRTWNSLGAAPSGYVPRIFAGQGAVGGGLIMVGGLDASGATRADGLYYDSSSAGQLVSAPPSAVLSTPERLSQGVWCNDSDTCWFWSGGNIVGTTRTMLPGGASYSITTKAWSAMISSGEPSPRARASTVWTGTSAIVWGGMNTTTALADGGIFTP